MNRERYPSDLTDEQWELAQSLLPTKVGGRPRAVPLRDILDAYFYLLRGGVSWRMLPHDFPPGRPSTPRSAAASATASGRPPTTASATRPASPRAGRPNPAPQRWTARRSSPPTTRGSGGATRGKKINGRKRHVLVDVLGLLLAVVVTPASKQDRDGAKDVLRAAQGRFPRLRVIWADGGYAGALMGWAKPVCGWLVRTILKPEGQKGLVVLPKRWVVERTFGWFMKYRRLVRDYETEPEMSETMIRAAMIHRMLRRLC